jgi:hypothetical protein
MATRPDGNFTYPPPPLLLPPGAEVTKQPEGSLLFFPPPAEGEDEGEGELNVQRLKSNRSKLFPVAILVGNSGDINLNSYAITVSVPRIIEI